MIFIVVKFPVRAEFSETWLEHVAEFTTATRAEAGNVFFEWSRSADEPNEYVLVEGFRDDEAGQAHVGSAHFKAAMAWMPTAVSATPKIINVTTPGDGWSQMAEISPTVG